MNYNISAAPGEEGKRWGQAHSLPWMNSIKPKHSKSSEYIELVTIQKSK